jgi:hypothetical protein
MLKDKIKKKINEKNTKNNSSQLGLTSQTRDPSHEMGIIS